MLSNSNKKKQQKALLLKGRNELSKIFIIDKNNSLVKLNLLLNNKQINLKK